MPRPNPSDPFGRVPALQGMWWWAPACVEVAPPEELSAVTDDTEPPVLPDARGYTEACEAALGPLPAFDCAELPQLPQQATLADGTVLDLTVRGAMSPDGTCDRPSILSGCHGGSRAGVLTNEEGSTFWLSCRVSASDTPEGLYDDIALIGRAIDGATCMWGVPETGLWRDGSALPEPGSDGDDIWADPVTMARIACRSCHDGNGVILTPFIAGYVGQPPLAPDAPIHVLFEEALAAIDPSWAGTPQWVHPEAEPCLACHALPQGPTCTFGPAATGRMPDGLLSPALREWPTDRWMDDLDPEVLADVHGTEEHWEQTYGAAADRLMACCGGLTKDCWNDHHSPTKEGP